MLNVGTKFVLLAVSGVLLIGGSNLSSASNAGSAADKADVNSSTEKQEAIGASRQAPFACPAEVLAIMAKAFKQASMVDASASDAQEAPTESTSEQTYPMMFPD